MKRSLLLSVLLFAGLAFAENSLGTLFTNHTVSGSIVIYHVNTAKWIYSDLNDANKGTIPASTFKIFNSLIALEENAITLTEVIEWDGKDKTFKGYPVKSWNADTNLESAFKNSTIWFYVELSKRIARPTYERYLRKCDYSNFDVTEAGDDFWNYGNLKTSPINQVEFLTKLYGNELPFKKENMKLLKANMRIDSNKTYSFSGKSGWGIKDGSDIGWLIGFLEKGHDAYIYATRIIVDSKNVPGNFGDLRSIITLEAFRRLSIID